MKKYKVWVRLEDTFEVEAESEEEAFIEASNMAMGGGSWDYDVLDVEDMPDEEDFEENL